MVVESVRTRSTGWIVASGLTMTAFYVGMHNFFPKGGGRELVWSPAEQLLGDSYVLLTLVMLIIWVTPAVRPAWRASRAPLASMISVISR
jgi:hypothetical protein